MANHPRVHVTLIHAGLGFDPGKFYVMDSFGRTAHEARVSGPWDTAEDAEQDRAALNCADDCYVCQERA